MRRWTWLAAAAGAAGWCATAAALTPDQVVVIYNARSADSAAVAEHYMRARGIPPSHLVPITCAPGERIDEDVYREAIVPGVQAVLKERKLEGTVRCLVTTYDVPLIINGVKISAADAATSGKLQRELDATIASLVKAEGEYDNIGQAGGMVVEAHPTTQRGKEALPEIVKELNGAASSAARRVMMLPTGEREGAMKSLETEQRDVAGAEGLASLRAAVAQTAMTEAADKAAAEARDEAAALRKQYADLQKMDAPAAKSDMIQSRRESGGLIGEAEELIRQMTLLTPQETESCFDNELALVLAADQNYPRARWMVNPRDVEMWPRVKAMTDVPRTLMVCRIDGATPGAAMDLVNRGLAAEKKGLEGKLYLDARGLHGTDAYAQYDEDIRKTADWLKLHSTQEVVLDDTPALLEAKNCPDAALYCGWYSLHQFHDSCQFVSGAVAFHVASLEMMTIRNAKDTGWVPQLLQKPIAGTLGAVAEPYLTAFPKPSEFFPLLLSGEFTQGEVWELTDPWLSWRVGYVGDPLYNPYKADPKVSADVLRADAVLRNAWDALGR